MAFEVFEHGILKRRVLEGLARPDGISPRARRAEARWNAGFRAPATRRQSRAGTLAGVSGASSPVTAASPASARGALRPCHRAPLAARS